MLKAVRWRLEHLAFIAACGLGRRLPLTMVSKFGEMLGITHFFLDRRRREIADFNLSLVFPEWTVEQRVEIAKAAACHLGRALLETAVVWRRGPEELLSMVTLEGAGIVKELEGRGFFLLSAHIGVWEIAALIAGLLIEGGLAVVGRPLDNPLLDRELAAIRTAFGNRSLGKRRVAAKVLKVVRSGGVVGILIDQRALESEGMELPFFGRPTPTHLALARFSMRTDAPVVPIWGIWESPGRYRVVWEEPIWPGGWRDPGELTVAYLRRIERVVKEFPGQWLWYHDRWRRIRLSQ